MAMAVQSGVLRILVALLSGKRTCDRSSDDPPQTCDDANGLHETANARNEEETIIASTKEHNTFLRGLGSCGQAETVTAVNSSDPRVRYEEPAGSYGRDGFRKTYCRDQLCGACYRQLGEPSSQ